MSAVVRQLLESVDDLQITIPQLLAELRKFDDVCDIFAIVYNSIISDDESHITQESKQFAKIIGEEGKQVLLDIKV